MLLVEEFIKLSRDERRTHLKLEESCCERGGNSTNHKGVLAQYLNTTIPSGRILLCHACNNGKCSNPRHLYWGTDHDNIIIDGAEFNTHKSPWHRRVEKYGYEKACSMNSRVGNTHGAGNKGKPKSEEHKARIRESRKNQTTNNGGRKPLMPPEEIIKYVNDYGIKQSAEMLNQSYKNFRSRYYSALKKLTCKNK